MMQQRSLLMTKEIGSTSKSTTTRSMEEERWITTASHPLDRGIVLRIAWTSRPRSGIAFTRIISARPATRRERKFYEDEIANQ
jgi:uncharacterized DUF497 family protein